MLLVSLFLFATLSAYYQGKFKEISERYAKEQETLKEATSNAVLEQLNDTLSSKETLQTDKQLLEQKYFDLRFQNEDMLNEKAKLEAELSSLRSELEDYKSKFGILQKRFQNAQDSILKTNEELSKLFSRLNGVCQKLKENGGSDENCK